MQVVGELERRLGHIPTEVRFERRTAGAEQVDAEVALEALSLLEPSVPEETALEARKCVAEAPTEAAPVAAEGKNSPESVLSLEERMNASRPLASPRRPA